MYQSHGSQHLSREKTLQQLFTVPPKLRATLKAWLNRAMEDRDASDRFAKANPNAPKVTVSQCKLMAQAHSAGISYRALERVFHLRPQSGNSAQRCVWRAAGPKKPAAKKKTSAIKVKAVA